MLCAIGSLFQKTLPGDDHAAKYNLATTCRQIGSKSKSAASCGHINRCVIGEYLLMILSGIHILLCYGNLHPRVLNFAGRGHFSFPIIVFSILATEFRTMASLTGILLAS